MRKNQQRKNKLLKKDNELLDEYIKLSQKEKYDKDFNELNDIYEKSLYKLNTCQNKLNELHESIQNVEQMKDTIIPSSVMATYEINKKLLEETKKSFSTYETEHKNAYDKLESFKKTGKLEEEKKEDKKNNNNHKETLKNANEMWIFVKKYVEQNPEFKELKDKQKIELFRNKLGYAKLMDELPIVTRYMICMGQYSSTALLRVMEKANTMKHPPEHERPKGYMQDQWVRRQADYVQFMWEHYNKHRHYSLAEKKYVYEHTYNLLKGEFDDFKNMHEEIEKRVKDEKKESTGKNVRELLERLQTGKQQLLKEEENILMEELNNILIKNNFKNVMKQLSETKKTIKENCSSEGTGNAKPRQTIRMIETVNADRMNEIDDKYKPDEYRGMIPDDEYYDIVEEMFIE